MNRHSLKEILERLYREYDFRARLGHDPLSFAHRYTEPQDQEVVAFIAAAFAYGRVQLFFRVIEDILERMGPHPAEFLRGFEQKEHGPMFQGLYYRLSRDGDILRFLAGIGAVLRRYRTLEDLFKESLSDDLRTRLRAFVDTLRDHALEVSPLKGFRYSEGGLRHLLPVLSGSSAAKRLNLFLRWMVRDRDIDLGLWRCLRPSDLVIPLDTHIARISRCLGLTKRKNPSWAMAEEITENLKRFDPEDPLKYDFALCHEGIRGYCMALCKGKVPCPLGE